MVAAGLLIEESTMGEGGMGRKAGTDQAAQSVMAWTLDSLSTLLFPAPPLTSRLPLRQVAVLSPSHCASRR